MAGTLFSMSLLPQMATLVSYPDVRGRWANAGLVCLSRQSLPTDSIGLANVTFDGVVAGSEIRVYLPDGTEVAGIEDCSLDQMLSWGVYASGSPNNSVRIVIVNLFYRLKDFIYLSRLGNSSIPIQMEEDSWYTNP